MSQAELLWRGLGELGLDLPGEAQRKLLDYLALLAKWNRTYNLTAVRDEVAMVGQHVLDSLAVLPWLTFDTLADIGSGGGLPGIPLAIARPEGRVALVESNQKKSAFLQQAKIELGLANVDVVQTRAEGWQPEPLFDTVTSRAFSDLAEFLRLTSHLLAPGGVFAAMKGVHPYEEIAQIPAGFAVEKVIPLTVPQVEGVRHLVLIRKTP
jgi:16S rRNA (guanine527-N7)-methyltransferase